MSEGATSFAERLKTLRERAGLSQYALAKLTGLSKQALSRLELDEREPSWATVQLIASALGVDCTAFSNGPVQLPEAEEGRPVGRPKKSAESDAQATTPKKGKATVQASEPAAAKSKKKGKAK